MQENMFIPDPITQITEGDEAVYRYFPKQIRVVGVGGAGCNIINYLYSLGAFGAHMMAVDTDEKRLSVIRADEKFLIGKSVAREAGTHGDVGMGRLSAEKSGWKLEEAAKGTKLMFIAGGMGGGTGTGALPVIAQQARDRGAIVVAIVTMPFQDEAEARLKAKAGIEKLIDVANTTIVIDFEKMRGYDRSEPRAEALGMMDELIAEKLKTIIEAMTKRPLVHVNILDLNRLLTNGGLSIMLVGRDRSDDNLLNVLDNTLKYPLCGIDYHGASAAFIHVASGRDMSIEGVKKIVEYLYDSVNSTVNVLYGARLEHTSDCRVRITVILTGLKKEAFTEAYS
jgi:cell division protein FtsZ